MIMNSPTKLIESRFNKIKKFGLRITFIDLHYSDVIMQTKENIKALRQWLCKQSRRRWFETPLRSLWRHGNVTLTKFDDN